MLLSMSSGARGPRRTITQATTIPSGTASMHPAASSRLVDGCSRPQGMLSLTSVDRLASV